MIYFLKVDCENSCYNAVEIYYSKVSAYVRYNHLKSYIDNEIGMIESIYLIDSDGVVVAGAGRR